MLESDNCRPAGRTNELVIIVGIEDQNKGRVFVLINYMSLLVKEYCIVRGLCVILSQ